MRLVCCRYSSFDSIANARHLSKGSEMHQGVCLYALGPLSFAQLWAVRFGDTAFTCTNECTALYLYADSVG